MTTYARLLSLIQSAFPVEKVLFPIGGSTFLLLLLRLWPCAIAIHVFAMRIPRANVATALLLQAPAISRHPLVLLLQSNVQWHLATWMLDVTDVTDG